MSMYPIDLDVRRIATRFGVDPALIQAVETAEGNLLKAVQCSIPSIDTREKALEVTCRSAARAMSDYIKTQGRDGFVTFWGHRWAPVGAANDPTALNQNWPKNVLRIWLKAAP